MNTHPSLPHYPFTAGDLNIYHARRIADQQVTYVLDFPGRLDTERLEAALDTLAHAVPVLGCRVEARGSRFRWLAAAWKPVSLVVFDPPKDAPAPVGAEEAALRFISTPCDPESQPPLKTLLVHGEGGDRLCLKVDHVLADAGGLKSLLYLLSEAYTRGTIHQPVNPNRGLGQVFRTFSVPTLLDAALHADVPRPGAALTGGTFDRQPVFIEHACLEAPAFERLHGFTRQVGATLNDALLAAVYRAVYEQLPGVTDYPVMAPVDMRRYLPEEKRWIVGNLSSALYPRLSPAPGETFQGTLARVKAVMDGFKGRAPGLGAAILMNLGALGGGRILRDRYQAAAQRGSRFINLTNFGVIEEARCDFGGLLPVEAYGVGPIQYAPGILIAVSSYRQALHLTVQANDTSTFQPFLRGFMASILSTLQEI